jgi:hypothetical protein|tara:strand:- start:1573 stop:1980 length:408 start_codon:yes stop_codon:yes gene_type:complete
MEDNTNVNIRPQIAGELNKFSNELSNHDLDLIYDKLYQKDLSDKKKNIFDLSLNKIIHNTISFLDHFQSDYSSKLYEVELLEEDEKKKNMVMKYFTAFGLYIREHDNIIYLGIILVIFSFILYFFSISSDVRVIE